MNTNQLTELVDAISDINKAVGKITSLVYKALEEETRLASIPISLFKFETHTVPPKEDPHHT